MVRPAGGRCGPPDAQGRPIISLAGWGDADAGKAVASRLVFGVEADRVAIGAGGLCLVAAAFVDERLVCPRFGDVAVELDRMVEIGKGVVVVVQRDVGNAAAIIGLG